MAKLRSLLLVDNFDAGSCNAGIASDSPGSVFAGEQPQECKDKSKLSKDCPDVAFLPGEVAMFKIYNHHDYYNISMILNGETGLQFVAETAEKGVK